MKRRLITQALLALSMAGVLAPLPAAVAGEAPSAWPTRPARIVVPFPPGGSADVMARFVAQRMSEKYGQQFIVENRAGAAGNIGADAVAKAAPDGYMLGLMTSGPLANNKHLYKNMPFDPQKNLTPIVLVGEIPLVIVSHPGVKARNLRELIELARSAPNKVSVGHPGTGTIGHLALELINLDANVKFLNVPYKGDTPALADVMGGAVNAVSAPVTPFIANIKAGKINGMALLASKRFAGLPDVPTAVELGLNIESAVWFAMVGPAGLPRTIVDRINADVNVFINSTEGRAQLDRFGAVVGGGTPERLGSLMSTESVKWKRVVDAINLKLD